MPVSMIICCDIMSYMFGFFFGKTPLIKLSPKKTWEGFLGGAASTVLFGLAVFFHLWFLKLFTWKYEIAALVLFGWQGVLRVPARIFGKCGELYEWLHDTALFPAAWIWRAAVRRTLECRQYAVNLQAPELRLHASAQATAHHHLPILTPLDCLRLICIPDRTFWGLLCIGLQARLQN